MSWLTLSCSKRMGMRPGAAQHQGKLTHDLGRKRRMRGISRAGGRRGGAARRLRRHGIGDTMLRPARATTRAPGDLDLDRGDRRMAVIELPDGSKRDVPDGTTVGQVAESIGRGLAKAAV